VLVAEITVEGPEGAAEPWKLEKVRQLELEGKQEAQDGAS
jgi:hypothetical protein